MGRHVARMGMSRKHKNSVVKLEGNRPVRRLRRKWEDIIKMVIKEMGCVFRLGSSGSG
jgi:hypothetical protein